MKKQVFGYDAGTLYLPDLLHNQILELAVR